LRADLILVNAAILFEPAIVQSYFLFAHTVLVLPILRVAGADCAVPATWGRYTDAARPRALQRVWTRQLLILRDIESRELTQARISHPNILDGAIRLNANRSTTAVRRNISRRTQPVK
jgi:hypothetical protein